DFGQNSGLSALRSPDFSVLTREDALFYTALAQGAGGGIWPVHIMKRRRQCSCQYCRQQQSLKS
ncbi:MAG: hypothetical protein VYD85_04295, partial [Pseudomonadota bacterium]|nr:hypothetical protein [Pseudomonadota bacterium]